MRAALCTLLVLAVCAPSARAAQTDLCGPLRTGDPGVDIVHNLLTETNHTGVVDLYLQNVGDAPVTFYECLNGRPFKLGTVAQHGQQMTGLEGAVPWLCGRLARDFRATATLSDGTPIRAAATARTPNCARRFFLTAPRAVKPGATATVTVTDTWRTGGISTRLCITSPAGDRRCPGVSFAAAVGKRAVRFRATQRGRYRLEFQVRQFRQHRGVAVGVRAAAPTPRPLLLATGDSTMNGVANALSDELGGFDVKPQIFPGAEISIADWLALSRDQVAGLRPAVTVVSTGATEGFPLRSPDKTVHECCSPGWVAEYIRRVRTMMQTYRRGGRARVYWETIALARDPARAAIVRICNQAMVEAAKGLKGVYVLRMDLLFTPNGYQETIRDGGRDVPIREPDGIHLNASGTAIQARETAKAIRGEATPVYSPSG
jgi:hypothetical protein